MRLAGALPKHLPRVETAVEPERLDCPRCGGVLHRIGGDPSERLGVIPAQFRVLVPAGPDMPAAAAPKAWSGRRLRPG